MEWRTIKQYPMYAITRDGMVRNKRSKKLLAQRLTNRNYTVQLYDGVGAHTCKAPKLLEQTLGNNNTVPKEKRRILHIHLKIEGVGGSEENTL